MKKTLTAVLLVLFILTLFTACGDNKDHSDTESSAGTNNCCENSISTEDNSITGNDCCSTTDNSLDESSETENIDDLQVPDCCG